jgi:hypothetical protein
LPPDEERLCRPDVCWVAGAVDSAALRGDVACGAVM